MAKEYTTKSMRELTRLTETGELEKFWRVEAVTTGGIRFTTDIPDSQMRLDSAAAFLAPKAKELDAIMKA